MDKIYSGEIAQVRGVDLLIDLLADEGVQLRDKRNRLLGCNFFVYDKSSWSKKQEKPLCLGLIYQKPNQVKTQDIFIISLSRGIETFYSEKEMVKKYPLMKGAHKDNLPI